jgi:hypothetical protein
MYYATEEFKAKREQMFVNIPIQNSEEKTLYQDVLGVYIENGEQEKAHIYFEIQKENIKNIFVVINMTKDLGDKELIYKTYEEYTKEKPDFVYLWSSFRDYCEETGNTKKQKEIEVKIKEIESSE